MATIRDALVLPVVVLLCPLGACGTDDPVAPARGDLILVLDTSGPDPDPDGYTLLLDGAPREVLPVTGTVSVPDIPAGDHTVGLAGVAANCSPTPVLPTTVTIAAGADATLPLALVCGKILPHDLAYVEAGDIFLRPALGGRPTNLTQEPGFDVEPAWSPDGARLAFRSTRNGSDDIYVMAADGTGLLQLTSGAAGDADPEWSPDGTWILFTRQTAGASDLYRVRADGSELVNLTGGAGRSSQGSWSPDGGRIAFVSTRRGVVAEGDTVLELHVMQADGSGVTALEGEVPRSGDDLDPDWSPDGTQIVFWTSEETELANFHVTADYRIDADGTDLVQLGSDTRPRWSPDGSRILASRVLFGGGISDPNPTYLVVRDISSGETRVLRDEPDAFQFYGTWAPDGEWIAFCYQGLPVRGVSVLQPDGSGFTPLSADCDGSVAWRPGAP